MTRVKTRVGSASECEVRLQSGDVDERQCYIEYSSPHWQLHQESRKHPTFVNGSPESHKELKHRSKVTFSDGSGFELIDLQELNREISRRRKMWILLAVAGITAIAAVAGMLYFNG